MCIRIEECGGDQLKSLTFHFPWAIRTAHVRDREMAKTTSTKKKANNVGNNRCECFCHRWTLLRTKQMEHYTGKNYHNYVFFFFFLFPLLYACLPSLWFLLFFPIRFNSDATNQAYWRCLSVTLDLSHAIFNISST